MLHQFYEKHNFDWEEARQGMLLILWGLFKKVVIADRLALIVDNIYNAPAGHSSLSFLVATVFFTFQIYCDFSGYSDIALGSAQVLGFRLMTNFNRPYFAKSVAEFWTRWHISLSTWFRDYLYIPMGGNRLGKNRLYFNLAVVFILSGFWHGANYTFIIYGMFHAFYIIFGIATKKFRIKALSKIGIAYPSRINDILSVGIVFILCTFTRIFFRAKNVDDALYISNHLWQGWKPISASYLKAVFAEMGGGNLLFGTFNTVAGLLLIAILQYIDIITVNKPFHALLQNKPKALRWGFYYVLILSILLIGSYTNKEFIYFQF